jgi:hypothetical protein
MCRRRIALCSLSIMNALLLLAALPLGAQQDQAVMSIQTANGQSTFHIGERIPLKLTFSSPNDTDYRIAPLIGSRGAEFDCNRFEVTSPATGWSDPLEMYFKQNLLRTGHGWIRPPLLKSKPVEASLNLNEWIRFDEPGDYAVKVSSSCVSENKGRPGGPLSGTITLQIVPATPEWQSEKFKSIQANLDLLDEPVSKEVNGESIQSQMTRRDQLFQSARADLKYLATPDAIKEMTSRLRDEKYNFADQCRMGLIGLPASMRETAIASMNRRIEEPDFPISGWFFSTLSFLHVTPGSDKESIRKQREAAVPVIWSAIFSAVTKKEPAARAQTVQTLLDYGRNISTPKLTMQMSSLLKLSFLDLDDQQQEDDLRAEWDRLKSPEFLPVLQILARRPLRYPDDFESGSNTRQMLKGLALKRWYELDPEGAHREILAQIGSASPTLAAQSIAFLPPEQLPQFEPIWAKALLDTTSQPREQALGSLLVRFGAGAATSQMMAKLDAKRNYPCNPHSVELAYLVRFDPDLARKRLKQEFSGKCGDNLLTSISALVTAPVLNDQAVENLASISPQIVRDALQYLTAYGRKEDEAPLWRRYVQWTAAYEGRPGLLDRQGNDWYKTFDNSIMGQELGSALIMGQGWFADQELIARVLKSCVGERMCERLKGDADQAAPPYQIELPHPEDSSESVADLWIRVAQYQTRSLELFEQKISQFPPGSKFLLSRNRPFTGDDQKLEAQVRSILEKHGMSLQISKD